LVPALKLQTIFKKASCMCVYHYSCLYSLTSSVCKP
jgi:hypothetical protein